MLYIVDEHLQRFTVDRFNHIRIGFVQIQHPFKNGLLLHEITGVDGAEFVAVECKGWQVLQVVFLVNAFIGCLHKVNVFLFTFIIDVLQFVENLLGFFVTLAVCKLQINTKKRILLFANK